MLFIYLMIGLYQKNNGLLTRILAGQKKHIHTFLLLDFKAAHICGQYSQVKAGRRKRIKKRTFLFLPLICLPTFITRPKLVILSTTLEK